MAASGNLEMLSLSSVFDESGCLQTKKRQFTYRKQSEKSSSGKKLAEKGRKRIFQKQKSKSTTIAIDLFREIIIIQVETAEYLDLLNS